MVYGVISGVISIHKGHNDPRIWSVVLFLAWFLSTKGILTLECGLWYYFWHDFCPPRAYLHWTKVCGIISVLVSIHLGHIDTWIWSVVLFLAWYLSSKSIMTLEYGLWYYFWRDFYSLRAYRHWNMVCGISSGMISVHQGHNNSVIRSFVLFLAWFIST